MRSLVASALVAAGALASFVAAAPAAHADPNQQCRAPYTIKVGSVSATVQPCVFKFMGGDDQWHVNGWTTVQGASTQIWAYAALGYAYCGSRGCNGVTWLYPGRVLYPDNGSTAYAPSQTAGHLCWWVKSSIGESSIGTVGDVESPPVCA